MYSQRTISESWKQTSKMTQILCAVYKIGIELLQRNSKAKSCIKGWHKLVLLPWDLLDYLGHAFVKFRSIWLKRFGFFIYKLQVSLCTIQA